MTEPIVRDEREANPSSLGDRELSKIKAEVRRQGFAVTTDAMIPGATAVAAPVFATEASLPLVVVIVVPRSHGSPEIVAEVREQLLATTKAISAELGYAVGLKTPFRQVISANCRGVDERQGGGRVDGGALNVEVGTHSDGYSPMLTEPLLVRPVHIDHASGGGALVSQCDDGHPRCPQCRNGSVVLQLRQQIGGHQQVEAVACDEVEPLWPRSVIGDTLDGQLSAPRPGAGREKAHGDATGSDLRRVPRRNAFGDQAWIFCVRRR